MKKPPLMPQRRLLSCESQKGHAHSADGRLKVDEARPGEPGNPLAKHDSEIFNKFGPASFSDRRCTMRNPDFVADGLFLALIATCLVMLCSGLLVLAFS